MHLFKDVLQEYLGEISGATLRDHFDVVYQVHPVFQDNGLRID